MIPKRIKCLLNKTHDINSMASSSSKKRPKSKPSESSSKSSLTSSAFLWEPPDELFPSKEELSRLFIAMAIAVSVFLSCNFFADYFSSPLPKPFCDTGLDSADFLSDSCEPCPMNSQCRDGKLECVRGYRQHGNLCIEDRDIIQIAYKLSEWIQFLLCESYALHLCGGVGSIWVEEDEIWNGLDENEFMGHVGSDSAVNSYTKQKALEIIDKVLEIKTNSHGVRELKCPDALSQSYKPFSCRVRQWVSKNLFMILPIGVLIVGLVLLIRKVRQSLYISKRVDELYHQVCEVLEESAVMSKGVNIECEPWVVASMLRDHLLSPKERKNTVLWKKVEELVREDSRIDRYPKLVKGESKVVWEWQVEGSLSTSKMKNDATKEDPTKIMGLNSNQHRQRLKTENGRALAF